jgi:flagellar hook-basal body complex protein FliE
MTWETIQAQASISSVGPAPIAIGAIAAPQAVGGMQPAGGASDFASLVSQGVTGLNQQLMLSQVDLQRLATGDVQNLHQVMMRLEETRLSFQLFLQVRNRLLEAYQDVMKMQI